MLKSQPVLSLKNTWNSGHREELFTYVVLYLRLTASTTFCMAMIVFCPVAHPRSAILNGLEGSNWVMLI